MSLDHLWFLSIVFCSILYTSDWHILLNFSIRNWILSSSGSCFVYRKTTDFFFNWSQSYNNDELIFILEDLLKTDPLGFLTQKIMPCISKHFHFCLAFGSLHALIPFLFSWIIFKSLPAIHRMPIFLLLKSMDCSPSPMQTTCQPSPNCRSLSSSAMLQQY